MIKRYSLVKLLELFVARKIAGLPLADKVVVNSVHPNLCKSDFGREAPWLLNWILQALAWKTEQGAQCVG